MIPLIRSSIGATAQQRVGLLSVVAEVGQVVNGLQHRFSSGHGAIVESLLAAPEVEAREGQIPVAKLGLDRARLKHRSADIVLGGPSLD